VILEAFGRRKSGAYRRGLLELVTCLVAIAMLSGTPRALAQTAAVFNVFNIQNYGVPDTNVIQQDPNAGKITSTVSDSPRDIQLGAHLNFL
jgi:hypothetical protein